VPEGDSVFRAARTLQRALAGRTVTRFESVFPRLTRIDDDAPIRGRTVERVDARGKHLLIWFSGGLVLRTHMRMNGSWHIYRPGERWQRPHSDMRIVLETDDMHAVAFSVPVAEFETAAALERTPALRDLGPDLLAEEFVAADAVERLAARADMDIADALLDQSAVAGIGNIYKSEVLFAGRINPFLKVREITRDDIERLVAIAVKFLRANVADGVPGGITTYSGLRRTTGRSDPGGRLWVYGRGGKPCRRCGTPVSRAKQGPHARSTYWCARCQPGRT
jgi:endonuclease VIII